MNSCDHTVSVTEHACFWLVVSGSSGFFFGAGQVQVYLIIIHVNYPVTMAMNNDTQFAALAGAPGRNTRNRKQIVLSARADGQRDMSGASQVQLQICQGFGISPDDKIDGWSGWKQLSSLIWDRKPHSVNQSITSTRTNSPCNSYQHSQSIQRPYVHSILHRIFI